MEISAILHEPKSAMAYAFDKHTLHVRLKTKKNDVCAVTMLAFDPFCWAPDPSNPLIYKFDQDSIYYAPMTKAYSAVEHDIWFGEFDQSRWGRIRYAFLLEDGQKKCFFGPNETRFYQENIPFDTHNTFNFPCILEEDIYHAPEWVKDTVWYQIFPDRFARSQTAVECTWNWGENERGDTDRIFGGNLNGIAEKLDYIKGLGCNGIYFTPIFKSPSSHKYDTTDYFEIDPSFGTKEDFKALVDAAHAKGIRIMLDAVFNHCGYEHPFWQDVLKNGSSSIYADCFYIVDKDKPISHYKNEELAIGAMGENLNYYTFGFSENMPKWNTKNPIAREYLLEVACYWAREYGIDGWRLDVSNEVSHDFWRAFRKKMKRINPDLYILGENWDNAYPWLMGDQFDAVMNYGFTDPVTRFLGKQEDNAYTATDFTNAISKLLSAYPKHTMKNLFNLLDSHDTPRIFSICDENTEKVKMAYAIQMTMTGCPSIYYGGEIGMAGDEHANRQCMIWREERQGSDLFQTLKQLIALRRANPIFRQVDIEWLITDDCAGIVLFKKEDDSGILYIALHNSDATDEMNLPQELQNRQATDLLTGKAFVFDTAYALPPYSFFLWYMEKSK